MKILFIQTGGTIDKDYPKTTNAYGFEIGESAVNRILNRIDIVFDYEIISILKKDSLDLNAQDRNLIVKTCIKSNVDKIIITHGTDTMLDTAKALSQIKNRTIIITGSKKPEKFQDSDAMFNLGNAVGAVQWLGNGVYIALNGGVFDWRECIRDEITGLYYEKGMILPRVNGVGRLLTTR